MLNSNGSPRALDCARRLNGTSRSGLWFHITFARSKSAFSRLGATASILSAGLSYVEDATTRLILNSLPLATLRQLEGRVAESTSTANSANLNAGGTT